MGAHFLAVELDNAILFSSVSGLLKFIMVPVVEFQISWPVQSYLSIYASIGSIKGPLSGLRQFLIIETPLKMMKNAFYFTSKALLVLKIFKFLS